jgi:hypothetical protein
MVIVLVIAIVLVIFVVITIAEAHFPAFLNHPTLLVDNFLS